LRRYSLVPTAEVVGITKPRGADLVAVIAEEEERDMAANPHRRASASVLAVPMAGAYTRSRSSST
jgi:hypothetical protein